MKKHTCHLDFHQRSRYVTIGQRNWVRKLIDNIKGKLIDNQKGKVNRQPEGEVARQEKFFLPTQLIPNPIRDRSGQLGITQDVIVVQDETSRSQEISVNSFNEEFCSSDRSGQPGITQDVISVQACSSEENKNVRVEQTHDQGNLVKTQLQYKTTLKYIMRPERSTLTMRHFVKD